MGVRAFLTNVAILSTIMGVVALMEAAVPMFAHTSRAPGRRSTNLGLTATVFLLNWALSSVAAILALTVSLQRVDLLGRLGAPMFLQVVGGIVLLDFSFGYVAHRALHVFPLLWRFHRVHHSDDFVDVTTTYRTHPVEVVWRFLFVIVPVWMIGIPAQAVVIQRLLSAMNGILEHANIRLWTPVDHVLSLVWVTPSVHKIHHSREVAETNSNYGNVLSIYDRVLGTFTSSDRAARVAYGLDDADPTQMDSLGGLLSMPFKDVERSLTQKSGSGRPSIDNIPV